MREANQARLRGGVLTLLLCLLPLVAVAADFTERQWMEQLVAGLGWEYGLPDQPQDEDYARLLSGQRSLRLEVETSHRQTDRVAVKHYTNYGEYSGSGWVSGFRQPTSVHLEVLLLHSGRYRLAAATRLSGIKLELADQEFIAPGGEMFARHDLGVVELPAGLTQIVITLPPNGAIDYLELLAPATVRIAPLAGWHAQQPLKTADLALTALQLLDLLAYLPPTQNIYPFELEAAAPVAGVQQSTSRHLGMPSNAAWLRSGNRPARLELPFQVPQAACYQVWLRGSGEEPIGVQLADYFSREIRFGNRLATRSLGSYCLPQQTLLLELQLPAWAGGDRLELRQYDSSARALTRLLGLSSEQQRLDQQLSNDLLELIAALRR